MAVPPWGRDSVVMFICLVKHHYSTTWRRTVERERNSAGWHTWDEARAAAANRENWRHSVEALCATRHKEAK